MIYQREIIHEGGRQLTDQMIEISTFKEARVKQGGYGLFRNDFWIQRTANRGFHAFVITLSGHGRIRMEDESEILMGPGDAFISWASGQGHYEETVGMEPWEMIWITFWDKTSRFTPDSNDYRVVRGITSLTDIKHPFLKIFDEAFYSDSRSAEALELYERIFLINMERALDLGETTETRTHRTEISKLWDMVNKNMADYWGVERLCQVSGFSRAHLSRLCNELYGIGPGEMVKDIRMRHARLLLTNSDMTIAEISDATGFSSPSVFSASFKEYFKVSPRDFKKTKSI